MDKKRWIFLLIAVALTTAAVFSIGTYYVTIKMIDKGEIYINDQSYDDLMKYFEISKIREIVEEYYLSEVDTEELLKGSFTGMLHSLNDGYSAFYTVEDYQYVDVKNEGSYIAEGMLVKYDANMEYPMVVRVFADTAAFEAGVEAGDFLLSLDGKSAKGMDIEVILGHIRGADGTSIELQIKRRSATMMAQLIRKTASTQQVYTDMINSSVGYINIVEFSGDSVSQFEKALKSMKSEKAGSVVIDLRGVMGGNISQAVEILDMMLDAGEAAYTAGRESKSMSWETDAETTWDKPVVILVDADTMGVSEVFAAALQYRGRAAVIGMPTKGKAYVTSFFQIQSTGSMLKLVTGKYCLPDGTEIGGKGVVPDLILTEEDILAAEEGKDAYLVKAAEFLKK